MIASLRRYRWLAALLLIASPAVAGQVLPAIHPCPVAAELPGLPDDHRHHGAELPTDQGGSGHQGDCTCIGSCQVTTGQVPPESPRIIRSLFELIDTPTNRLVQTAPSIVRPIDRLPPTTAPPRA